MKVPLRPCHRGPAPLVVAAVVLWAGALGGCATQSSEVEASTRREPSAASGVDGASVLATPEVLPSAVVTRQLTPEPAPAPAVSPTPSPTPAPTPPPAPPAPPAPIASRRASTAVSRGRTDRRAVALTFDAGADRGHAERVLDVLARAGVTAAFGITGEWGDANRDLLARIAREGHVLINHSYDHSSFTGVSWSKVARTRAERESQLGRTEQVFNSTTDKPRTPYFRPPFGDYDASVLADVGALGYPVTVMWSVDSMGWRGWTASQITQRCLEGVHAGAIFIFHVGSASKDADALLPVIEGLRARGYDIVSLPDLLDPPS